MNPRVNRIVGGIGVAVGLFYLFMTFQIRATIAADAIGPRLFPFVISAAMIATSVWTIVASYMPGKAESEDRGAIEWTGWPLVAATGAACLLYAALFEWLGFMLDTALLLVAVLAYANPGQWRVNVPVAVLFSVVAAYGFDVLLGIPLPAGLVPLWGVK
ncbi:MAG: tripartite tricarboxylate transporter TctB family protein [Clostridia bacterium]|nr:tripartite tricarboxylate transporter TctB family protein [Clostridia bacterium]